MTDNTQLVREKLDQAVGILREQDVDAWMIFVHETMLAPDPSLPLVLGADVVWLSAFIITHDDQRIAIVGKHDVEIVNVVGGYTKVIPYVEGIRGSLVATLTDLNPRTLALNYSENDVAADGLGHGMMLLLQRYLADTDLPDRFISAERIVGALRGRKSPAELARIRTAITTTQHIFTQTGEMIEPGVSETRIAGQIHAYLAERGLGTAWDRNGCPAVSAGPDSPVGHGGPQDKYKVTPGAIVHMDFGVMENDYCADLQRVWYVRRDENDDVPDALRSAFAAGRRALLAGFAALKPGAAGWEVDAAARQTLIDEGYPEYQHAFGHHIGRAAHDGATVLGPRWERYGQTPFGLVEAGNVFAIELGIEVEGYGYIGLEENVVVTEDGAVWLSEPQTEIWVI
jgi:Xaa-Pro aminopeptidase